MQENIWSFPSWVKFCHLCRCQFRPGRREPICLAWPTDIISANYRGFLVRIPESGSSWEVGSRFLVRIGGTVYRTVYKILLSVGLILSMESQYSSFLDPILNHDSTWTRFSCYLQSLLLPFLHFSPLSIITHLQLISWTNMSMTAIRQRRFAMRQIFNRRATRNWYCWYFDDTIKLSGHDSRERSMNRWILSKFSST